MAKSPEDMAAGMIANLKEKTGKPIGDWLKIVNKSQLAKHGEIVKFLKGEHGVTHGYANMIAHQALQQDAPDTGGDGLVAAQYSGDKAGLKAIYDKLIAAVQKFGADVEISPKKTYVSLRRSKQFGLIQPSTKTRVDVGINLKGEPPSGRLEASGSFNAMVSHRVRVAAESAVDKELLVWLKRAYESA
jgi:Domain of unknown function (DUF5655)/Domain of unknown function (DUF4287)